MTVEAFVTTTPRHVERRARDRRRSVPSVHAALAAFMGPRLRMRSAFQLRIGLSAIENGSGSVLVISIPASRSKPIEVQTYPAGVTIALTQSVGVHT